MGGCCQREITLDDLLYQQLNGLKLRSMNYDKMKDIIKNHLINFELNEELKNKLSGKNLAAFETSLNKISKENMLKLCDDYFIDNLDEVKHIKTQKIYFKKICDASNNDRNFILFHLLPLVKSSDKEKMNIFINLVYIIENKTILTYLKFKKVVYLFVEHCLILPSLSFMESVKEEGDDDLAQEIEEQVRNSFRPENLQVFVDNFFEDFEHKNLSQLDDLSIERYTLNLEEIKEILNKYKKSGFFNLFDLRALYLSQFS